MNSRTACEAVRAANIEAAAYAACGDDPVMILEKAEAGEIPTPTEAQKAARQDCRRLAHDLQEWLGVQRDPNGLRTANVEIAFDNTHTSAQLYYTRPFQGLQLVASDRNQSAQILDDLIEGRAAIYKIARLYSRSGGTAIHDYPISEVRNHR